MEIRHNKLYPYPVLSPYTDDYTKSSFEVEASPTRDGYNLRIDFIAELKDARLEDLIATGKAQIAYHLECPQTCFRAVFKTSHYNSVAVVLNKNVSGRLQICPYIVVATDIADYANENFHEDYRGFRFDLETGCIMAVARQINIDVNTERDEFSTTSSVISIIRNADEAATAMLVDMDQRKILIKLKEKDFVSYKNLSNEPLVKPILNSLVVVPALVYVLDEVAKRVPGDRYEYSSHSWYRTIKKVISTRFSCDMDTDQFTEQNMLEIAQKLINTPLSDALHRLSLGYAGEFFDEDDEE